jgi:enoyl-CoA hydratase
MTDLVTTRTEGDITIARFDDGKANALSFDMLDQLNAALDAAEASSKAVALIGREGKFSAGFDLTVMNGGDLDATRRILQIGAELALRIFMSPIPVVLGITGHALAQGGIIAACADYRVGAEGPYKLGLPEVAIGMPMPTFGAELCRDRISKKWYTRCVQHGELLTPDHALEANLLDEVVGLDEVESRSAEVAAHLAATVHPGPFRVTRANLRGALADSVRVGLVADLAVFDVAR